MLETTGLPLSSGFRNQLDRASLSVSNNIAEGFERSTIAELLSFIAIARGSAGEVRSMMAVVKDRPGLRKLAAALGQIRTQAESCARQLTGWAASVQKLPFEGPRRLPEKVKRVRETAQKAQNFRTKFLATLSPTHPLYHTPEAQAARTQPPS